MTIVDIYFVGGFGSMGWVAAGDYTAAAVDPLADEASDLIREINREQAETLLLLARVFGNVDAQQATMTALDRLGFHLRIRTSDRMQGGRVAFTNPVANGQEVRAGLAGMAAQAREGLQALLHSSSVSVRTAPLRQSYVLTSIALTRRLTSSTIGERMATNDKQVIFSLVGVGKVYPPKRQVLRDIYLGFYYGAKIGVLGLNGSGKSSLLKIIAGVDPNYVGRGDALEGLQRRAPRTGTPARSQQDREGSRRRREEGTGGAPPRI